MNKLWIFGDSYSTYNREKGALPAPFSIYTKLANHLNLIETNKSISGLGNVDIYNNLLKFLSEYNSGDCIIFQLSFLDRFSYIDEVKNRKLNDHESELFSVSGRFFLHPQYYHNSNVELTESQKQAFTDFIKNNTNNLFDIYFKFFIQLKHIVSFLEKHNVKFKILILKESSMDYNEERIDICKLLAEFGLDKNILPIEDRKSIRSARFYVEAGEYEHHHFRLNTIEKYAEALKQSFK